MPIFFKKSYIPGPESNEEKRGVEVDKMMALWYSEEMSEDRSKLKRASRGWHVVFLVFVLFIVALGLGIIGIYWIIQGKSFSFLPGDEAPSDPIAIELSAPSEVNSGDEITVVLTYQNLSKARLTDVTLQMFYPENFIFLRSSGYEPNNLEKNFWRLPSFEPQSSYTIEVQGLVFGVSGEQKQIQAALLYKPTNFHSTFKKEISANLIVKESVLNVTLTGPDNLLMEQEVNYAISVKNTSLHSLAKVKAKLTFPEGFALKSTSDRLEEKEWAIPSIEPGESKELTVNGAISAESGSLKEFKAEVGLEKEGLFVLQNQVIHVAAVVDPVVTLNIDVQNPDRRVVFGELLEMKVAVTNLSTLTFENGTLEIVIDDSQDLLVQNSFKVVEENPYELIKEGSDLKKTEQLLRFAKLPAQSPSQEFVLHITSEIIDVPYDISQGDFKIRLAPSFHASSSDISVPFKRQGTSIEVEVFPAS